MKKSTTYSISSALTFRTGIALFILLVFWSSLRIYLCLGCLRERERRGVSTGRGNQLRYPFPKPFHTCKSRVAMFMFCLFGVTKQTLSKGPIPLRGTNALAIRGVLVQPQLVMVGLLSCLQGV